MATSASGRRESFVGRDSELNKLIYGLESLTNGTGRTIVVSGDAGMGKSALVEQFERHAQDQGAQIHWGRAHERAGAPPLWPWVQVFRSLAESGLPSDSPNSIGNNSSSQVVDLLSSQDEDDNPGESRASADPNARFRLFDAVANSLREAANSGPLVVVVDNLHWADATSLRLLEFVAEELRSEPVLLIGTYRDSESRRGTALSETIASLSRISGFTDIRMSRFDVPDVRDYIVSYVGIDPPQDLVDAVHEHSEGSPFFAINAVHLLDGQKRLTAESLNTPTDWDIGIPAGVKDVIGQRLDALPEFCVEVLQLAAVIGREFDLSVVDALFPNEAEDRMLDQLEAAISARILNESEEIADRFSFDHDLFRQTLESELRLSRRVRLHQQIAKILEDTPTGSQTEKIGRIALHYRQAESITDPEIVASACVSAGRAAISAKAYEAALDQFEFAQSVLVEGREEDLLLARVLDGIGRSKFALASVAAAFEPIAKAFEIYLECGATAEALDVSTVPLATAGRGGMAGLLEQAVEIAPDNSEVKSLLLSRLGAARAVELQDQSGAESAFKEAISVAQKAVSLRAESWAFGRWAIAASPDWSRVQELSARSAEIMPSNIDPEAAVHSRFWLGIALQNQGHLAEAREILLQAEEIAKQSRNPMRTAQSSRALSELARLQGGWQEVLDRESEIGYKLNARYSGPHVDRARVFLATGRYEEAAKDYETAKFIASTQTEPATRDGISSSFSDTWQTSIAGLVWVTGESSYFDDVPASQLRNSIPPEAYNVPDISRNIDVLDKISVAGLVSAFRSDAETAKKSFELLSSTGMRIAGPLLSFGGSFDRFIAFLAIAAGLQEQAQKYYERALEFCSSTGFVFDHGWTCHDLAKLLTESGNTDRVNELIETGLGIAEKYELKPLQEKLNELRSTRGTPPHQSPDGLTAREIEVLKELAAGKSNREIAEALFITHNTVIRHVSNIFSKTGSANRAQAAVYATENNLQ